MMPDAVAGAAVIQIGGIGAPVLPVFPQERFYLPPFHGNQRTDDIAPHRWNAGQSGASRAADQMEQHGFQIIIRGMGGCNALCPQLCRAAGEKIIPQLTGCRFHRHLLPLCFRSGITVSQTEGNAMGFTQPAAKFRIRIRLRAPQTMMQVAGADIISQLLQAYYQADRIRTAG